MQDQAEKVLRTWKREALFAPDKLSEYEVHDASSISLDFSHHYQSFSPPDGIHSNFVRLLKVALALRRQSWRTPK